MKLVHEQICFVSNYYFLINDVFNDIYFLLNYVFTCCLMFALHLCYSYFPIFHHRSQSLFTVNNLHSQLKMYVHQFNNNNQHILFTKFKQFTFYCPFGVVLKEHTYRLDYLQASSRLLHVIEIRFATQFFRAFSFIHSYSHFRAFIQTLLDSSFYVVLSRRRLYKFHIVIVICLVIIILTSFTQ